ncbi:MAG TPA: CsbD family protein [Ilumatobacteraceae bacterium]|nr:CsbD family protein [Ilumatobacteraceae bacterium]
MGSNIDQAKGRIKQAAGDLTDDRDLKNEGKADEAAGKAKEAVEKMGDKADDLIDRTRDKFDKR